MRTSFAVIVACAVTMAAHAAESQTVRDVLREHGIAPGTLTEPQLARHVNSYGVENGPDFFAVGFYDVRGNGVALPDTVHLFALDKRTARWTVAAISRHQSLRAEAGTADLGSILGIQHTVTHVIVDTHTSPSAGIILVLTRDLKPVTTLWGWSLRMLPNDLLLYHRGTVHFAPTHSAELGIYDARANRDTLIYPRKPHGDVRTRYIAQVKAVYDRLGEDWFRINNHHMDPERFDSRREDTLVVSTDGRSFATRFLFGDRDPVPGRTPALEVVVRCRALNTLSPLCTEEEWASVQRRFPGLTTARVLTEIVR